MPRGARNYNSAHNGSSTSSLERRGRGRGGRRGYGQLNARTPSMATVAQPLSSGDTKGYKQKRGRSKPDPAPGDDYDDVTFLYQNPRRTLNNRERQQNSWAQARGSKVGGYSDLVTTAAVEVPLSAEAVAAQTVTSLSLGATITTSSRDFTHSNSSQRTTELVFWHRLVDCQRLEDSLNNSGAALVVSDAVDESALMSTSSEMCLFSVGEDRLRTCVQAILDLKGLITYRRRCDKDPPSLMEGWYIPRSYFRAVVALARLCESAIPTRLPPLIAADVFPPEDALGKVASSGDGTEAGSENKDSRTWWPSPVSLTALQERLECARRVIQLRYVYSVLAPFVRHCNTVAQLTELLMPPQNPSPAPDARRDSNKSCNDSNRFVPFPSAPVHCVETQTLSDLILMANQDCALDTESWGTFAMPPLLKVRNGIYTVHRASRQNTLEKLLKREEELYGLPPFLRFIRRADVGFAPTYNHSEGLFGPELRSIPVVGVQHTSSESTHNVQGRSNDGVCAGNRSGISNKNQNYFFPSPEYLQPDAFSFPDPAYYPTVQEELIEIAAKHSCFGLVIGEADHIMKLWTDWTLYWTRLGKHQSKQEHNQEDSAPPVAIAGEKKRAACLDNAGDKVEQYSNRAGKSKERRQRRHPQGGAELPHRDPLLPFVYSAISRDKSKKEALSSGASLKVTAGGDHGSKDSEANRSPHSVFWLCENRWSTKTLYYGLVFEVVLQSNLGCYDQDNGMTPLASLDADSLDDKVLHKGDSRELNSGSPLIYYPNCLLELSR